MLRVRRERRPAVRVVVKVRYAPFVTQTHGHPLAAPTVEAAPIRQAALAALDKFTGRRIRLKKSALSNWRNKPKNSRLPP